MENPNVCPGRQLDALSPAGTAEGLNDPVLGFSSCLFSKVLILTGMQAVGPMTMG